ncbi:diaminobutyrate--2-oxoglutarate transaminase [Massilia pseudoviolaceinigra]|uniref:diaminobutyrate--2-oxoglutarate transaminase n=1 Tax=Massilia pseudoviolaceinigra TaxID=3057165 RepID=UPI0027967386|nr:diaminobutyrate--2-oxoglutarate transaminase [Massilia sp. CCM 9206]MDQ1920055.1 diaminobutyrate--2-oxoglutarate transaminase [Massilia sp. CCM 9206]
MPNNLASINEAFSTFEVHESKVRSYCRDFPVKIRHAKGSKIHSVDQQVYVDFFAGAGALNYGHNCEPLKEKLKAYLDNDGITHSLDFYTEAKEDFIQTFQEEILQRRGMKYKVQFTGPTGTNAVEAALKLARKVTKRSNVIAFSNAFHGMSLGSLAATSNPKKRQGAGVALGGVTFMPYEGYLGEHVDSIDLIARMLQPGSGVEAPAAFLIETIQGEGGLRCVSARWLQRLQALAHEHGALLIVDDIQSGCGRSGRFFSFEGMGVTPDIVCLSKSLSGYGLPFSMNLINPDHDVWEPGEHNGTFRGNNLAFVTAKAAIDTFWSAPAFERELQQKIVYLHSRLKALAERSSEYIPEARFLGRGFMCGIDVGSGEVASNISQAAFRAGLIVETCGVHGQVVKLLPALTIEYEVLVQGLDMLAAAFEQVIGIARYSEEKAA